MTQTVFSERNLHALLSYIIIPLVVIIILFFVGTKLYTYYSKDKDPNKRNYVINYWSNVMGIIFASILLSVSIGYVLAFTENLRNINAVEENQVLYYFFMFFPVFPFVFLIYYIGKFISNIKKKERLDLNNESEEE